MSVAHTALLGSQAIIGLVGVVVGGAKVTSQDGQIEEFQRYGIHSGSALLLASSKLGVGSASLWESSGNPS